jgi:Protein of unknown function (DUF3035)
VKRIATLGLVAIAAVSVTACGTVGAPDEFRVVRKAPLTVPPEYNLRPPAIGQTRPQELSPEVQARVAVFGVDVGQGASDGEKAFIRAAGGDAADRTIRNQVDFDSSQVLHKNRSFADMILNWGGDGGGPKEPVIDPAAEQERLRAQQAVLKEVTGDAPVVLQPKQTSKLPGL